MKKKTSLTFLIVLSLATVALAQNNISGSSKCGKPDEQHILEVGDHPNHSLMIDRSKCTWTKPLEIAGTQDKEYVTTESDEIQGNRSRGHGYAVDTMTNGDRAFVRFEGSATSKDGVMQSVEGKWSYVGGTGKLKGLKGKGTYKCKGETEGSTCDIEGEYALPGK